MKFMIRDAAALAILIGLTYAAECDANNCLRQVRATRFGPAQMAIASADCSSYLAGSTTTVTTTPGTGGTTTKTATKTVTQTFKFTDSTTVISLSVKTTTTTDILTIYTPVPLLHRRAERVVPTYASDCTRPSQYASACSCYGVFAPHTKTETAASLTPVTKTKTEVETDYTGVFITKTKSTKSTTTSTVHVPTATVKVGASNFYIRVATGPYTGRYAVSIDKDTGISSIIFVTDITLGPYSTIDEYEYEFAGPTTLQAFGGLKAIKAPDIYNSLALISDAYLTGNGYNPANYPPAICTVTNSILSCTAQDGSSVWYLCTDEEDGPPILYFQKPGDNPYPDFCSIATLRIVPF